MKRFRHRSFAAAFVFGLAGVTLAGCPSGPKALDDAKSPGTAPTGGGTAATGGYQSRFGLTEEPASVEGKYGGKITTANISDPKSFNVIVASETSSTDILAPLYETLNTLNAYTLKFEPRLADLPTISADGLTYTYKLREGVKWSDGKPLTADDVVFTLDVILDPKVENISREGMLIDVIQPDGSLKRTAFKYRKVDAQTVEFKLPVKFAPAQNIFGFAIVPKHIMEPVYKAGKFNSYLGVNTPPAELVGSGPLLIKEYVSGQRIVYKPNPNYWRKSKDGKQALPYIEETVFLIVPDLNTTTLKFRGKETDLLAVQQADYPDVKKGEAEGNYEVIDRGPAWGFTYLGLNQNPKAKIDKDLGELFRDVRFRKAISHSIDRKRISEDVYLGMAEPSYSPVASADKNFYNPNTPKFEYDLEKAKALLAEIGLKDGNGDGMLEYKGKNVQFNILTNTENDQRKAMATIVTDDLKKVGLDVKFTPVNFNDLVRRINTEPYDWQAIIMGFTGGPEPHNGSNIWRSSGPSHVWWPKQTKPGTPWEAEIDKLFIQGAQELDPAKRKAIYDKWQDILAEQQALTMLVTPTQFTAVRKGFGNVKPASVDRAGILWNREELFSESATKATP
jgi:peptide/nickel transport system substrate-binding protein